MHRVAITGLGIVSCLGNDLNTVSEALRNGRSGIEVDPKRIEMGFMSPLTGAVRDLDITKILGRKARKTMPEFAVWAYKAATDALAHAGIALDEIRGDPMTGIIFGCDSSSMAAVEQTEKMKLSRDTATLGSGLVFRSMTSTVTMNLNTLLGTRGASWSISSACSSGGHAVGQAADLIRLGRQKRIICGGAQEINWESMCSFDGLGAFAKRVDTPAQASRPFDSGRDGLVPSGGSAAIILERFEDAVARGAAILGEVLGYGFSSDGGHIAVPADDGLAAAMEMALENSGVNKTEIDYLCAHATSTPAGDAAEARNIKTLFGDSTPPLSSLKSMTGHELWMTGASQVVYCTLMARDGFIAPNINFETPDEASRGLNIIKQTIPHPPGKVMANSAGFGGTNCSLVLGYA